MENEIIQIVEERFGKDKIAELQEAFGGRKLGVIVVEDKICLLRPINARELSGYSLKVSNSDNGFEEAARYLLKELWIAGDEIILDDEECFMAAMLQIQNVVVVKNCHFIRVDKESLKTIEEYFGKEVIDKFQSSYVGRKLGVIAVEDKMCLLKPINARELSSYSIMAAQGDDGRLENAARYLLNELWLAGDEIILNDEEYFMAAMLQIQNAVEVKKSAFYRV